MLVVLLLRQLRQVEQMKIDIAFCDRMPIGDPGKCYTWLLTAARRIVTQNRMAWCRDEYKQKLTSVGHPAAVVTGPKGKGEKGKGDIPPDPKG